MIIIGHDLHLSFYSQSLEYGIFCTLIEDNAEIGYNSVVGKAQTLKGNISQAFSNGFQRALPSIRTFTNACDGIENALRHPVQTFNILKDKATSLGNNVKTKFSDVGQSIRYAFQNPGQVFEPMKLKAVSSGYSINGALG